MSSLTAFTPVASTVNVSLESVSNGYQATKIIEYTYTNYDLKKAADDLTAVSDELARAQTALDVINNSGQLEINF